LTPHLTDTPVLETERLVLRAPLPQDFENWAAFTESQRSRYAGGPLDRGAAWRAFGHMIGHWVLRGYGMFAITVKGNDEAIGIVGPYFPEGRPEKELGWTLSDARHEGLGYACEAALATRRHVYEVLGWRTAVSYIHPDNHRSIALAERLGATLDGEADRPAPGDLVFRHPGPEAL